MNKTLLSLILALVLVIISTPVIHAQVAGLSLNAQATNINVDQSSGAAVLPIKIDVPPGRAGIEPNLQLVYNSNGKSLGLAGIGWNMDLEFFCESENKNFLIFMRKNS